MVCEYDDGNGWCTGKFKGFGCIKGRCDSYSPIEFKEQDCIDLPGKGTYCHKYHRFFCAGKDNCEDGINYLRKLKMDSS